jgi:hypothetical protein
MENNNTDKLDWWGYLHTSGSLHVKRYFGALDTDEARDSPFVEAVAGPFKATGRDEAMAILMERLKVMGYAHT